MVTVDVIIPAPGAEPQVSRPTGHATPHGHQASLKDALAFVNTLEIVKGREVEHLPDVMSVLAWLGDHSLMHADMREAHLERLAADPDAAARVMRRTIRVRAAIRELVESTVDARPPEERALADLNRALCFHYVTYLVPAPDGVSLDHKHEGDPVDGALGRLAEAIARELTQGRPERLRVCQNPECRWIFVDTSHSGRRKWCDMRTCGNRVKVARHRQRRREEQPGEATTTTTAEATTIAEATVADSAS